MKHKKLTYRQLIKNPEFVKRMVVDSDNLKLIRKKFLTGKKMTKQDFTDVFTKLPLHPNLNWGRESLTMVPWAAIESIEFCIKNTLKRGVGGDFIETGAWRGGICIIAKVIYDYHNVKRKVFVADSFMGLPAPNKKLFPDDKGDKHYLDNNLKVPLKEVKRNFKKFNCLDDNVVFLAGWFKDTMPVASIDKLSILRLDGDIYESTIEVLENLYQKLSVGGYCIIDDYYHKGCQLAVKDFRSINKIVEPLIKVDNNPLNEVHFWVKREHINLVKTTYPLNNFKRHILYLRNNFL